MSTCPECGGDTSRVSNTVVSFKCKCGEDVKVRPSSVNPDTGVSVIHETTQSAMAGLLARMSSLSDDSGSTHTPKNCEYTSLVPPDAFCPGCRKNFRSGWESKVVSGSGEELEEARQRYDPIVRKYRALAREYISKHGPLQRVEYLSHFPAFEIQFVFSRKTIYSGRRTGKYDIHFLSLGYYGEGPRLARQFLDEAGYRMSYDAIASIKPGAVIHPDGTAVTVDHPSPPPARIQKAWWEFWK